MVSSLPSPAYGNTDDRILSLSSTFSVPGLVLCASFYYMTILILLREN